MTEVQLVSWINQLIKDGQLWKFYKSREWSGRRGYAGLKGEVLREQHYECQPCKERGAITRADTVHHVMHVREHPELALSRWYVDSRGVRHRNLLAVCRSCHNELHPEKSAKRAAGAAQKEKYVNEERW